jgi:hypothetical protein
VQCGVAYTAVRVDRSIHCQLRTTYTTYHTGQESDLPAVYQQRQCNEFMKLGMQGVSVVLASGDSGVGGPNGCIGSGNVFRYANDTLISVYLLCARSNDFQP